MASLNKVFLIGNLTRDPEVRYLPSGQAVADVRLAVSRRFRSANGETKEDTCYIDVVVWGRQAETCGQYLQRGSPLLVEGRLEYDEWEKDGQKRSRIRVVAERTQFLPRGTRSQDGGNDDSPPDAPPSQPRPQSRTPPVRQHSSEPQYTEDFPPAPPGGGGDEDNLPF